MPDYKMRNGSRLTPYMYWQIERLNKDFKSIFNVEIIVSSGIRLHQEQIDIFLKRYVTAANIRGRKVYDTRVWKGVRYYRIDRVGTVAQPGTSNHEIQKMANGKRKAAVDLRDSGKDAGLLTAGSKRSNWLKANAHKYGLKPTGFSFAEPWHFDIEDIDRLIPGSGGGSSKPAGGDNLVSKHQHYLNRIGYKLAVDGVKGPATAYAIKDFQKRNKLVADGIWGPKTEEKYAYVLARKRDILRRGSKGYDVRILQRKLDVKVDGIFGAATESAVRSFQKKEGLKSDGVVGVATWTELGI